MYNFLSRSVPPPPLTPPPPAPDPPKRQNDNNNNNDPITTNSPDQKASLTQLNLLPVAGLGVMESRESILGQEQLLLVGCLTSQQHASVSQGRICTDNLTCCHTEMEAADPTFHLTQSQYTDTGPTSPSADPIIPGAWQG